MRPSRRALAAVAVLAAAPAAAFAAPPLGNGPIRSVTLVASGPFRALDATPDPAGRAIVFTSTSHGFGRVEVVRKGALRVLAAGAPLADPRGVASGLDGRIFVADDRTAGGGAILVVPARGGRPVPLAGTVGTRPHGLDIVGARGRERIVYSGNDPHGDGQPAILSVPAAGGTPRVVVVGSPLSAPEGVAVGANGVVCVADPRARTVFRVRGGKATPLVTGVRLGSPAGIALTRDGSVLLVPSVRNGHARLLVVDLRTGKRGVVTRVVGANTGAGGLHRARAASVFAWAARTRTGDGAVYRINPA